jgi:alpha-tubulin suppressor-like RCC1 family protein
MRRSAVRRPLYSLVAVLLLAGALSASSVVDLPPASAAVAGGGFTGVTPFRALDTRESGGGGCVAAGATRTLVVANVGGVPADAGAVVLNVTVAGPVSPGFLTVFPDGVSRPLASNLNYVAGSVVPNRVTVKVGAGGRVAFFASGGCPQVIVDITGYYAGGTSAAGGFTGITPARAADTRETGGALAPGASRDVAVAGVGGVPANAAGAVLNATVVAGGGAGFLTVFPCGAARPTASNLNFTPGQVVPNAVTTRIGTGGCVTVYNGSPGQVDVIVDIAGYYSTGSPAAGGFSGITPFRARDTRDLGGCLQPGESRAIPVVGLGGVPARGASVALNVTVVPSTSSGFLTVYSDGVGRPTASNLNFVPGQIVPNAVMAKVGAGGRVVVYNGSGGCNHVIVDVAAWYSTGLGATAAPQVELGDSHSCAIQTAATVKCWGSNWSGQLGNGAVIEGGLSFTTGGTTLEPAPIAVLDLAEATEIAAGANHTCARTTGGTVECWGSNYYGQLGYDPTGGAGALSFPSGTPQSSPVEVAGLSGVTQIAAGGNHTCALLGDGTVRCWGANSNGQLGNGTYTASIAPVVVSGLSGVTRLTAGSSHTCAIVGSGGVRCWGANSQGQVGNGTTLVGFSFPLSGGADTNVPVVTLDVSTASDISAGANHTCVVVGGGAVQCWGSNWSGETGSSPTAAVLRPTTVPSLTGVIRIAAGGSGSNSGFSCALVSAGGVRCWGGGYSGELGNGLFDVSSTPVTVTGVTGAVALSAGGAHVCAVLPGGGNRCWGLNDSGQLGDGSINGIQRTPLAVASLSGATSVAAGYGHSCAVVTGGSVRCWGVNFYGQLGNGDTTGTPYSEVGGQDQTSPQNVGGVSNATQVVAGAQHSCALISGGTVRCWGGNYFGQLGDGTFTDTASSVAVPGLSGVTQLVAGDDHTCAIVGGGAAKCWGRNDAGQLGDGSVAGGGFSFPGAGGPPQASPVDVGGLSGATRLSAGQSHTCAVLGGGGVSCWGLNNGGQLGNGGNTNSSEPVTIDGLTGVTEIGSGRSHTCAVVAGGAVRCWGADWSGQLGDGTSGTASLVPGTVSGLSSVVRVAGGADHTCAVLSSGGVRCWGSNATAQFGTGLGASSATPVVAATGVSTAVRLASGYSHNCVTLSAGTVSCWGSNEFGQIGGGDVGSGKALSVLVSGFPAV